METLFNNMLNLLVENIDWPLALIIVLTSFWVKKNFTEIMPKVSTAVKVFFWSTIISLVYCGINYLTGIVELKNFSAYIITYLFSTSFYDVIAKPFTSWIKKIAGNDKNKSDE